MWHTKQQRDRVVYRILKILHFCLPIQTKYIIPIDPDTQSVRSDGANFPSQVFPPPPGGQRPNRPSRQFHGGLVLLMGRWQGQIDNQRDQEGHRGKKRKTTNGTTPKNRTVAKFAKIKTNKPTVINASVPSS